MELSGFFASGPAAAGAPNCNRGKERNLVDDGLCGISPGRRVQDDYRLYSTVTDFARLRG